MMAMMLQRFLQPKGDLKMKNIYNEIVPMTTQHKIDYCNKIMGMNDLYDNESLLLFNKHKRELNDEESLRLAEYVWDLENPVFRKVTCDYVDVDVEVNQTGTIVRDPETKKEYHVYYPDKKINDISYPSIWIRGGDRNRKSFSQSVHRLVAKAFVNNPDNLPEINHINGVKSCNWYKNLEWVTHSENIQHAFRTGLDEVLRGEDAGSTITTEQAHKICQLLKEHADWSFNKIAAETNSTIYIVRGIREGRIWAHVSKDYMPFPERRVPMSGEESGHAQFTNDQIHEVCQLLCDHPEMNYNQIAAETGVARPTVASISQGTRWTQISKEYMPFPARQTRAKGESHGNSKNEEYEIRQICEILDKVYAGQLKMSQWEIADTCRVSKNLVKDIWRGRAWVHVAKDYKFYQDKFGKDGDICG